MDSSHHRRPSEDLYKNVTLINSQVQKALEKLTIRKVLVLYTGQFVVVKSIFDRFLFSSSFVISGGTIGMKVIRKAYEPVSNFSTECVTRNEHYAQRWLCRENERSRSREIFSLLTVKYFRLLDFFLSMKKKKHVWSSLTKDEVNSSASTSFSFGHWQKNEELSFYLFFSSFSLTNDEVIAYYIKEYDPLLDSTNMTFDNYIHIALDIKVNDPQAIQMIFEVFILFCLGNLSFIRWFRQ